MDYKKCCQCKKRRALNEFHQDKSSKDGYASRCSLCDNQNHREYRMKNPEKVLADNIKYRPLYKDKQTWYDLKRNFGLEPEDFHRMLISQNGLCFICKTPMDGDRNVLVDHSHKTGKIRGLLCKCCNTGLGMFRDNILILSNAIEYIRKWE